MSYASEDADWARGLAARLTAHGLNVFFDQWSLGPGQVVLHEVERSLLDSANGVVVVSPASERSSRAREEYAALAHASAERGLRFVPVLLGSVDVPPFAANRVWQDFTGLAGQAYEKKAAELIAALTGRPPRNGSVPPETASAALPSPSRPLTAPEQPAFVVCAAAGDLRYGDRLAGQLREAGLPVWSLGDLRPGDPHFWTIRQQLAHALAVLVVMTPDSQDSDDITRMILEGRRHGRPFVPVLLHGALNYHLADTWYVDARGGRLLEESELALLHRFHRAQAAGRPLAAAEVLPRPLAEPAVPAVRVPVAAALERLRRLLAEDEYEHADLETTKLLLDEAGRLAEGWIPQRLGPALSTEALAGIDAVWAAHSGGRQGFRAQLGQGGRVSPGRRGTAGFVPLSVALGWRATAEQDIPLHYRDFVARAGPDRRTGFFPTLRNPQSEDFPDGYDQWTTTVLAVHMRLREWKAAF